jgi:hypothetical protein
MIITYQKNKLYEYFLFIISLFNIYFTCKAWRKGWIYMNRHFEVKKKRERDVYIKKKKKKRLQNGITFFFVFLLLNPHTSDVKYQCNITFFLGFSLAHKTRSFEMTGPYVLFSKWISVFVHHAHYLRFIWEKAHPCLFSKSIRVTHRWAKTYRVNIDMCYLCFFSKIFLFENQCENILFFFFLKKKSIIQTICFLFLWSDAESNDGQLKIEHFSLSF